jgi:uncharacterized membrane protein YbhN (UPF0104 family)
VDSNGQGKREEGKRLASQGKGGKPSLPVLLRWGGTLISLVLFLWLISRQNWNVVLAKAAGIAVWAILLSTALYLLSYLFNTLRWCILLWSQGVRIPLWPAYRINWAGSFASNFLPSTIGGDGFRMLAIHPYAGSKSISISSVVLDRIINMAAWACLIPAPLFIFGPSLGSLFGKMTGSAAGFALPAGLQKLVEKYFPKIISALQLWASKPWSLFYAFLAAWPSNLLPIAASYLLAHQLGMNVSFWQVLSVQTVAYFLSVLPISVNGYGLREVVFTTLYTALGASIEQASTLALVSRFLAVISTLPGSIWLSSALPGGGASALEETAP